MTGYYPHVHGHRTQAHLLRLGEENLFKELKDSGYFVWANPRGDLLAGDDREWQLQNFDVLFEEMNPSSADLSAYREKPSPDDYSFYRGIIESEDGKPIVDGDVFHTNAALEQIRDRPKDKPFMVFLGYIAPHPPYLVEQCYLDKVDMSKLPPRIPTINEGDGKPAMNVGLVKGLGVADWEEERFNQLRAVYLGMCAKVDDLVGQIVQGLKNEGIYDDTAIFILSDHGDFTGDFGIVEKSQNTFEDCLTNVPLIIKPPKGITVDTGVNDNLVELIDFYATAVDFADVAPKRDHFGKSLRETIEDKSVEVRDAVFCEGGRLPHEHHCAEVFNQNSFAAMFSDDYKPRWNVEADSTAHTKATMIRTKDYKYVKRKEEKDEFYDLTEQSRERFNRIDEPEYRDIILDLKDRMLGWYQETCDTVPHTLDARMQAGYMVNMMSRGGLPKEYLWSELVEKRRPIGEVLDEAGAFIKNIT